MIKIVVKCCRHVREEPDFVDKLLVLAHTIIIHAVHTFQTKNVMKLTLFKYINTATPSRR